MPITVQDGLTRKAFVVEPGETHPFLLAEATVRLVLRTSASIETVELAVRTASGLTSCRRPPSAATPCVPSTGQQG